MEILPFLSPAFLRRIQRSAILSFDRPVRLDRRSAWSAWQMRAAWPNVSKRPARAWTMEVRYTCGRKPHVGPMISVLLDNELVRVLRGNMSMNDDETARPREPGGCLLCKTHPAELYNQLCHICWDELTAELRQGTGRPDGTGLPEKELRDLALFLVSRRLVSRARSGSHERNAD